MGFLSFLGSCGDVQQQPAGITLLVTSAILSTGSVAQGTGALFFTVVSAQKVVHRRCAREAPKGDHRVANGTSQRRTCSERNDGIPIEMMQHIPASMQEPSNAYETVRSQSFREQSGTTPLQWLRRSRIHRAQYCSRPRGIPSSGSPSRSVSDLRRTSATASSGWSAPALALPACVPKFASLLTAEFVLQIKSLRAGTEFKIWNGGVGS